LSDGWNENGETVDYTRPITNGPTDVGFDYFFGIPASLDMVPYVYVENDRVIEPPTALIEGEEEYKFYRAGPCAPGFRHEEVLPKCTEKVVDFIEKHAEKKSTQPFFVYFPMSAPHTPILPTKKFQGRSGLGPYGDFVIQCDWSVGRIMTALERLDLSDNTLFIFTSDNGCSPMANFEHLEELDHDPSFIFRGHKADIYEGGHRIPFIARWPMRIKAGSSCDDTICLTDLIATVAEIIGYKLPDNAGEDSYSILNNLSGNEEKSFRPAVIHHSINGSFSIREGKWKLELCPGSGGWSYPKPKQALDLGLPMVQLYDLSKDIGEKENLQAQYPDVVYRLSNLLKEYVENGRSTPGKPQANEGVIQWRKESERS
jgi:arylsulfatase A-like enzyme